MTVMYMGVIIHRITAFHPVDESVLYILHFIEFLPYGYLRHTHDETVSADKKAVRRLLAVLSYG